MYIKIISDYTILNQQCFNQINWLNIFDKNLRVLGVFDNGDNLICNFNIYCIKKYGISICKTPPDAASIGPFFNMLPEKNESFYSLQKKILDLFIDYLKKEKFAIISLLLNKDIKFILPFYYNQFKVNTFFTYRIDLTQSNEVIWSNFSSKTRNHITKAQKDGLKVVKKFDAKIIEELVSNTYNRQRKSYSASQLINILNNLDNSKEVVSLITYNLEKPISCVLCIYDQTTMYNIIAGYNKDLAHHGAGAIAIWEAIKYAKSLGLKIFDFEGSMIPQIETYFRGFGGYLETYSSVHKALLPIEIVLKIVKRNIF